MGAAAGGRVHLGDDGQQQHGHSAGQKHVAQHRHSFQSDRKAGRHRKEATDLDFAIFMTPR